MDDITGLYDHGARSRNPISTLWYGVDPLCEKFPEMSPFAYCHGNPIQLNDLDGCEDKKSQANAKGQQHAQTQSQSSQTKSQSSQTKSQVKQTQSQTEPGWTDKLSAAASYCYNTVCEKANDAVNCVTEWCDKNINAVSIYGSGSAAIGGGVNCTVEIGYVRGDGPFVAVSTGVSGGADFSAGLGVKVSHYFGPGKATVDSYGGEGFSISGGLGPVDAGWSRSDDGNWHSVNIGGSVESPIGLTGSHTGTGVWKF